MLHFQTSKQAGFCCKRIKEKPQYIYISTVGPLLKWFELVYEAFGQSYFLSRSARKKLNVSKLKSLMTFQNIFNGLLVWPYWNYVNLLGKISLLIMVKKKLTKFKLSYFIKNSQTTNAPTFLTHNISAIGGVRHYCPNIDTLHCEWNWILICA